MGTFRMLVVLLLLALIGPFPAEAAERTRMAALVSDTSNPYWRTLEEGLRDTAAALNLQMDVYALRSATDGEGQLNQCETALLKKPEAIIFAAVDAVNLGSCLRKADAAGIVLIDIDGNVDEARARGMGVRLAFSVASDNYELGKKAAVYAGGLKGKALVLEGLSGSQPGALRIQGFRDNLGKDLTVVASQAADWDRLKAADVVQRILTQHPDLAVVFAANDTMALGAVEALRAAQVDTVKVIGVDGSADAVKAIREGKLAASVAQLPYLMAQEAIRKASHYVRDRHPLSFHQYVPVLTLDQKTFTENSEPLLRYVR